MTLSIPGVIHSDIDRHPDERGFFNEIFRSGHVEEELIQANHSRSVAGVLRGLHYHRSQADLWYVAQGALRVGLADLRRREKAPQTTIVEMSSESPATLYIPPGVAHGFAAVTQCDLIYWVTALYDSSDEFGIAWDDETLGLDWGISDPILSERDRANPPLNWDDIPSFS